MGHFYYDLFLPLLFSILTLSSAYVVGLFVLKRIRIIQGINLLSVGVSILLGYGILGYWAVVWTFFVPLNFPISVIAIISILILGPKDILHLFLKIKSAVLSWKILDLKDKLFFSLVILFFLFYLSSAFVPPYRTDVLGYHLPEVKMIAQNGILSVSTVGNLYGVSPILLESLYSLMYVLSGYTLINLVHYQLLLAGLLIIYYFAKEKFGELTAQFSIILIFSLYEIFVNATNAYIDAAMAAYQMAGMILVMIWFKDRDKNLLIGAGALYGLALSIKYLSLYALVLILPFIFFVSFAQDKSIRIAVKSLLYFAVPTFLFSGFWYIKNLVLFGNPFYPFIFSHPGFTKEQMEMSNIAIREFRPRTIENFLLFPFVLFKEKYYLTGLSAFLFLPLGFLWAAKDKLFRCMLIFVFGYFTLWFFLISHQKRFVMIGLFFLMICFGYILSKIYSHYQNFFDNKIVRALIVVIILVGAGVIFTAKEGYFLKVKRAELSYLFGFTSTEQFYSQRGLGEIFRLSEYINKNYKDAKFLPLWGDDTLFFLDNSDTFIFIHDYLKQGDTFDADSFKQFLKTNGVNLVIDFDQSYQDKIMKEWYNTNNPSANDYRDKVVVKIIKISDFIPEIGEVVYNEYGRIIYAIK